MIVGLVIITIAALSMSVPATANGVIAEIGDITRSGCLVTIPVTTYVADEYTLLVYDDGIVIDETTWEGTEGDEVEITWTITEPAMEAVPGVGFYLVDSADEDVADVDPWEYPASVADSCAVAGDMTVVVIGSTTYAPGQRIDFKATGFWPEEDVTVEAFSTPVLLDTLASDIDGIVEGSVTVPLEFPAGEHTLVLTGELSGLTVSTGFTVEGEVVETPAPVTVQPRFTG